MQQDNKDAAGALFRQAYELSAEHQFDYHTVNAAHMMPFITETAEEKVLWNERSLAIAENSPQVRTQEWAGSLYHNVSQSYLETKQYEKAQTSAQKALKYRELEGHSFNIRSAKWAVARSRKT